MFRLVMEMRKLIMINNSCKDGSSLPPVRLGSSQCDLPFREKEQKISMQLEAAYQNKTGSGHFSLLSLPQDSRFAFAFTLMIIIIIIIIKQKQDANKIWKAGIRYMCLYYLYIYVHKTQIQ